MNMKKLLSEIRELKDPEADEKELLNEFIERKIETGEIPPDFDCSYFECHQLYRELIK